LPVLLVGKPFLGRLGKCPQAAGREVRQKVLSTGGAGVGSGLAGRIAPEKPMPGA